MAVGRVFPVLRSFAPVPRKSIISVRCYPLKEQCRSLSVARALYERYFTKDHEWIEVEGNIGKVGITNYAQENLGELVFIELPEVGAEVEKEAPVGVVESVKAASDVLSPVSGVIKSINDKLVADRSLVNADPESKGWMFTIELRNTSELEELLNKEAYTKYLKEKA